MSCPSPTGGTAYRTRFFACINQAYDTSGYPPLRHINIYYIMRQWWSAFLLQLVAATRVWRPDRAPIAPRALSRCTPHPPPLRPIGARPPPAAGRIRSDHVGRPARILLLGPNWQNGADEQQRVGQTTTHKAGGIGNLRANGVGALLSSFMVCGHRAAMQHLMTAVHAVFEASASMHRMGPAPGQQEARAGEVSGREKQGGASGRPRAGARKQRGTRGRAVPARACAKIGLKQLFWCRYT